MNLICTQEFPFIAGFVSHLSTLLAGFKDQSAEARLQMLRTDSGQLRMPDDAHADLMCSLQVTVGDEGSVLWRCVVVEVGEITAAQQYAIRLSMYGGVSAAEDMLLASDVLYEDQFVCPSTKNNAIDVGRVIATATAGFLRDKRLPESHEFLQGALDACEEEY